MVYLATSIEVSGFHRSPDFYRFKGWKPFSIERCKKWRKSQKQMWNNNFYWAQWISSLARFYRPTVGSRFLWRDEKNDKNHEGEHEIIMSPPGANFCWALWISSLARFYCPNGRKLFLSGDKKKDKNQRGEHEHHHHPNAHTQFFFFFWQTYLAFFLRILGDENFHFCGIIGLTLSIRIWKFSPSKILVPSPKLTPIRHRQNPTKEFYNNFPILGI